MGRRSGGDLIVGEIMRRAHCMGGSLVELARRSGVDSALLGPMAEGRLTPTVAQLRRLIGASRSLAAGSGVEVLPPP